jgi:hypothetical protein
MLLEFQSSAFDRSAISPIKDLQQLVEVSSKHLTAPLSGKNHAFCRGSSEALP